jgi:hypothetical protein
VSATATHLSLRGDDTDAERHLIAQRS